MKDKKLIRVLHYIPYFNYGGIENLIININKNIDLNKVQFDYLVEKDIPKKYRILIENNGGKIYKICDMSNKIIFKHIKELIKVLKENKNSILHCHYVDGRPFILPIAKILGIKRRILHIHAKNFSTKSHYFIRKLFMKSNIIFSTDYMACSDEAADKMLGNKISQKTKVIFNGIDIEKFKFNENNKKEILNQYNLNGKIVLGQVGRFGDLKNQIFSVKVLNEINKKYKNNNFCLMLVGDGPSKEKIMHKVKQHNLQDKVIFTGIQNNIKKYLDAMDLFLFPSISEGFGIAAIEAQANNLTCFVSDGIPEIVNCGKCRFFSIDGTEKMWADEIIKYFSEKTNFELSLEKLKRFDIKSIATEFEKEYLKGDI